MNKSGFVTALTSLHKKAENHSESIKVKLQKEISELEERKDELEQLSQTGDDLHLLQVLCHIFSLFFSKQKSNCRLEVLSWLFSIFCNEMSSLHNNVVLHANIQISILSICPAFLSQSLHSLSDPPNINDWSEISAYSDSAVGIVRSAVIKLLHKLHREMTNEMNRLVTKGTVRLS